MDDLNPKHEAGSAMSTKLMGEDYNSEQRPMPNWGHYTWSKVSDNMFLGNPKQDGREPIFLRFAKGRAYWHQEGDKEYKLLKKHANQAISAFVHMTPDTDVQDEVVDKLLAAYPRCKSDLELRRDALIIGSQLWKWRKILGN